MSQPAIPGGYILLARRVRQTELWAGPAWKLKLWLHILMQASHADDARSGLKRGQCLITYADLQAMLAERRGNSTWQPTRAMLSREIARHVDAGRLLARRTTRGTVLTIVNYATYQDPANYRVAAKIPDTSQIHPRYERGTPRGTARGTLDAGHNSNPRRDFGTRPAGRAEHHEEHRAEHARNTRGNTIYKEEEITKKEETHTRVSASADATEEITEADVPGWQDFPDHSDEPDTLKLAMDMWRLTVGGRHFSRAWREHVGDALSSVGVTLEDFRTAVDAVDDYGVRKLTVTTDPWDIKAAIIEAAQERQRREGAEKARAQYEREEAERRKAAAERERAELEAAKSLPQPLNDIEREEFWREAKRRLGRPLEPAPDTSEEIPL